MLACNLVRYDLQNCGLTVENVHSAHLNTNLSDRIYVRFYSNISWELCDVSRRNVIKLVYVRYRSCGRRLSSTLKIMRKMNFLHIVHSTWASESQIRTSFRERYSTIYFSCTAQTNSSRAAWSSCLT